VSDVFSGIYQDPKTGRVQQIYVSVKNMSAALRKLPRHIIKDGIKFRRRGGIRKHLPGELKK
jgi:hypothetical protein